MTHLDNGAVATDLDDATNKKILADRGYTISHLETWRRNHEGSARPTAAGHAPPEAPRSQCTAPR
jgi:hypothetical protein